MNPQIYFKGRLEGRKEGRKEERKKGRKEGKKYFFAVSFFLISI
jgi:hypothetical protein